MNDLGYSFGQNYDGLAKFMVGVVKFQEALGKIQRSGMELEFKLLKKWNDQKNSELEIETSWNGTRNRIETELI